MRKYNHFDRIYSETSSSDFLDVPLAIATWSQDKVSCSSVLIICVCVFYFMCALAMQSDKADIGLRFNEHIIVKNMSSSDSKIPKTRSCNK